MEHLVLKALNFQMTSPTVNWFLLHFLRLVNANKKTENLARVRVDRIALNLLDLKLISCHFQVPGRIDTRPSRTIPRISTESNSRVGVVLVSVQIRQNMDHADKRKGGLSEKRNPPVCT
jgi:hypothetical protein